MNWRTVTYIFVFVLVFWGLEHTRRHLWEPDEARYAFVAREMMQEGHWAVPHRHGEYYAHKPPLYFWLIRFASQLSGRGVDGVTARLPSLLASFVSLLVTGLFAVKYFGRKAVLPSLLVLATCFLYWHEGGMGRMDSVLLALELCAVYLLVTGDERSSDVRRAFGYIFMGLGVLAKGPVGLIVPLLVYLALRKTGDRRLFAAHLAWGLPLALLFPLLWLAAAWVEGAPNEYFQELIFKQNFGRLSGKVSFGKPRPVYFYLIHVPAEFMPWTILLPASIAALIKGSRKTELKSLAGWALAVLLFFTLSSGKRNLYVLMAYPAMALMVGGGCGFLKLLSGRWRMATAAVMIAVMLLMGIGQVLAPLCVSIAEKQYGAVIDLPVSLALLLPSGLVLTGGAAALTMLYRRKGLGRPFCVGTGFAFALNWVIISNLFLPALNEHKTPVEVVDAVEVYRDAGDKMIIYGTTSEIVPLYCNMKSRSASDPQELRQEMIEQGKGVVVFREKAWRELKETVLGVEVIGEATVGHKTMVLVGYGR